jgi:hypothetical protein
MEDTCEYCGHELTVTNNYYGGFGGFVDAEAFCSNGFCPSEHPDCPDCESGTVYYHTPDEGICGDCQFHTDVQAHELPRRLKHAS